eukprot:2948665-Prymnesium_polylepis.1
MDAWHSQRSNDLGGKKRTGKIDYSRFNLVDSDDEDTPAAKPPAPAHPNLPPSMQAAMMRAQVASD